MSASEKQFEIEKLKKRGITYVEPEVEMEPTQESLRDKLRNQLNSFGASGTVETDEQAGQLSIR